MQTNTNPARQRHTPFFLAILPKKAYSLSGLASLPKMRSQQRRAFSTWRVPVPTKARKAEICPMLQPT